MLAKFSLESSFLAVCPIMSFNWSQYRAAMSRLGTQALELQLCCSRQHPTSCLDEQSNDSYPGLGPKLNQADETGLTLSNMLQVIKVYLLSPFHNWWFVQQRANLTSVRGGCLQSQRVFFCSCLTPQLSLQRKLTPCLSCFQWLSTSFRQELCRTNTTASQYTLR